MWSVQALQTICTRSVGRLQQYNVSSRLTYQSLQRQRQRSMEVGSDKVATANIPQGLCTLADEVDPNARKVLQFWYVTQALSGSTAHVLFASLVLSQLLTGLAITMLTRQPTAFQPRR